METFEEWINKIISTNNLCGDYKKKVDNAKSNKQIMDIVLDSNGFTYLQEMQQESMMLPYDIISTRFANYINGRYKAEFRNEKGNGYTSTIYCNYNNPISVDTTLLSLLNCNCELNIKENHICMIACDSNCYVSVNCPQSSRVILELYGNAKCKMDKDLTNVEIIKH